MEKTVPSRKKGEVCLICETEQTSGIHICDQFICVSCEQRMVKTSSGDATYPYYLKKLKSLRLSRVCDEHRR
ncbi:MAG TPA: sigma factor G inhibitor Gin [Bacillales bacterium]|nr:sigma factor G inhibitor Gin [Bacillales bacterium]